ncbi:polyadenylate-binding protein-interacting protein 1 [Ambystoma mexicanum]|uniref:polyadenylate-binding protein-interacting protein 1 n=1 Tax=Ambystoma mexicanum TaxID=8296 RepID=UPI0037E8E5E5
MSDCFDRAPGAGRSLGRGRAQFLPGGRAGPLGSGRGRAVSPEDSRGRAAPLLDSGRGPGVRPPSAEQKPGPAQPEPLRQPRSAPPVATSSAPDPLRRPKSLPPINDMYVAHNSQPSPPPSAQDILSAQSSGPPVSKVQIANSTAVASQLSVNAPEFYPPGYASASTDYGNGYENCPALPYANLAEYVQDFLNHLTEQPGTFEVEITQFTDLLNIWVVTEEALQELVELLYQQATTLPNFCYMGARLCNYLSHHLTMSPPSGNFRQLLLKRCQTEFEKREQAAKGDDVARKRFHAFILFLGELYLNLEIKGAKGQIARAEILQVALWELLTALFSNPVDSNLICAVKLLKLTGSVLEDAWKEKGKTDMEEIIQRMENVVLDANCSRDVKQMLLKLVELRSSNWGRVHAASTYSEATPENDPNYFMNEPTFYTSDGVPFTAADPDYQEKYQELLDREDLLPEFEENGTDLSGGGDPYFDDDEMDPEIEEAFEKFCLESERKRKQ